MELSYFIAFLVLVISLFSISLLIWFQNKGISEQLQIINIREYTKRYQEIFNRFPKSVLDANFDLRSLQEEERESLLRLMSIYFNLCFEQYILHYKLNLIDKKLWHIWELSMRSAFIKPAFRQCWDFIVNNSFYPDYFRKFVNNNMRMLH